MTVSRVVAELAFREGVDQYLAERSGVEPEQRIERAIRAAGKFSSGSVDVSANHDAHLTEAFGQ